MFSIGPMFFEPDFGNIILVSCFNVLIFNFHLLPLILILDRGVLMLRVEFVVIIIWLSSGHIKRLVRLLLFEFDVLLEEVIDLLIEEDILSVVFLKKVLHFKNLIDIVEGMSFVVDEFVHLRALVSDSE